MHIFKISPISVVLRNRTLAAAVIPSCKLKWSQLEVVLLRTRSELSI